MLSAISRIELGFTTLKFEAKFLSLNYTIQYCLKSNYKKRVISPCLPWGAYLLILLKMLALQDMINWTTARTKCLCITCWLWKAVQLWVSLSWKALICSRELLMKRRNISPLLSGVPALKYPTALPSSAEDLSASSAAGSLVKGSGNGQLQECVPRCGKYASPKHKSEQGKAFLEEWARSVAIPALWQHWSLQGVQTNPFSLQLRDDR